MTTLLERFIPEAREHLEIAAADLLKLERDPANEGLVNEVFRSIHTLKGASGLFDVPGLTRLLHAGEDLLGAVRSGVLKFDPEMVDALLDTLDRVSAWIDELQRHGLLPDDADGVSVGMSRRLRAFLPNVDDVVNADALAAPASRTEWLAELPEADRLTAFAESLAGGPPLLAVSYVPDDGCFYRGEDPFNLFPQLAGLRHCRSFAASRCAAEPRPIRSAAPWHSAPWWHRAESEVEHLLRYVIEQVVDRHRSARGADPAGWGFGERTGASPPRGGCEARACSTRLLRPAQLPSRGFWSRPMASLGRVGIALA